MNLLRSVALPPFLVIVLSEVNSLDETVDPVDDTELWVTNFPSSLMVVAEPAPLVTEMLGCGIWRRPEVFALLRRLLSLIDSSPLIGVVGKSPVLTAPKIRVSSFQGKWQLDSLGKSGRGGDGTPKSYLSRSKIRAAAALSKG